MFHTQKRTLERQVPFKEKHAVELQALIDTAHIVGYVLLSFVIGLIIGGYL